MNYLFIYLDIDMNYLFRPAQQIETHPQHIRRMCCGMRLGLTRDRQIYVDTYSDMYIVVIYIYIYIYVSG